MGDGRLRANQPIGGMYPGDEGRPRKRVLPAPIVGHVGDGNFHVLMVLDPDSKEEEAEAQRLNDRIVERALAMDGTCTGEHGIGLGKQRWLRAELGKAVDIMVAVKQALDPLNLFNPGKIFYG